MSSRGCPITGYNDSDSAMECPMGSRGPLGCAFAAFQPNMGASIAYWTGSDHPSELHHSERKTLQDILMPEAPSRQTTKGLKNADDLNPTDDDLLAIALGAPGRRVLMRAEEIGPRTGWKDGYLSSQFGFLPPDASDSPVALRSSPGRVWSDLCERMPGVVARGNVRNSILALPLVFGTPDVIPDRALWAATVCLGILASVYRYEENNDGNEGVSVIAPPGSFRNISGEADDEEEETKGIPRNIAIPLRQICTRMGDPTSVLPYAARTENMDLRWPVFNNRGEAMFLLCMAEVHGCFQSGVEVITRCQEAVMNRDTEALLQELITLKTIVDQLPYVFHRISVNPSAGEQFANPVEWGQRYAKFSAPLSKRAPALSGLALPLFLLMDAFIGRTKYASFLGVEAVHLRRWLPLNIRAFITAIENHYKVPEFVQASGDPRLAGVLEGIIESYAGERGFLGTHRYKVYGFLEVVAKTGRTETNGNAGAGDTDGRAWEEVHRTLSDSMKERLDPYRGEVKVQPHEMRGSFEECRFQARILHRQGIDADPMRSTGMVTFDLYNTGITFQPGDRLAVMPSNHSHEITKVAAALGFENIMDSVVPVEQGSEWARFMKHLEAVSKVPSSGLTVRDVLKRGHLAPLTKNVMVTIHQMLRASIGDLLQSAIAEVPQDVWDESFDLYNLAWLPKLIRLEVPRTYSISNASDGLLPRMVDLTVSRTETPRHPLFEGVQPAIPFYGVSSGFLNPHPNLFDPIASSDNEAVLMGVSRPIQFQLPPSNTVPVAMFAGGSGIAPFRGFWQARARSGIGRNILFLGVQSRAKFVHEAELRGMIQQGSLELHTAFSRDRHGLIYDPINRDLIEKDIEPRYIDTTIIDQGRLVSELVMSKSQGGLGGYFYICGSVSVYETAMSGIKQAIYTHQAWTQHTADTLLATAFAERRFMLDIFMTPQAIPRSNPVIPLSKLSAHTGHRNGSRMWIGVHGGVYNVTDFLPMHPGGTLIVAASAGLDATKTFDDLAHTSNPEVSSLLSRYFIGHLASKPDFKSPELSGLYDMWYQYLRSSVEDLTTLFFEANNILEDSKVWFSGGLLNIGGVRKFYQFQSRLLQNGFSTLFGAKLQEIYLKLSYVLANTVNPSIRLPDVIGTITRAQSSLCATKCMREISEVGQFVCNSSTSARFHENGILKYAQAVTELDLYFLEQVRDEVALGMDAFDIIASNDESTSVKQTKLASYLLAVLERIAARLESYYSALSQESVYRPKIEYNPARTRWSNVRRKIADGSLFVTHCKPTHTFMPSPQNTLEPRRLADMHTSRPLHSNQAASTFESQQAATALRKTSTFLNDNISTIRRLSRLPDEYDFAHIMATYGKHGRAPNLSVARTQTQTPSSTSSSSSRGLRTRAPTGTSDTAPMIAPQALQNYSHALQRVQQQATDAHFLHRTASTSPPVPPNDLASTPLPLRRAVTTPDAAPALTTANAALAHLNRRQPPRSASPLPASPRASLALRATGSLARRKMPPLPPLPPLPQSGAETVPSVVSSASSSGLRALELSAGAGIGVRADASMREVRARV
ncbi:hypothetical protein M011DRAFT_496723 [Sporormia fimetaria CBS 119925]|uniref:NADPH--hemoprotein reductase n=1 Tax=Sporormia fimetaria CBS 119925 TaxID=1340428 RepID=A0A6A6V383_9PLEO|nr:hypothetical protein M011DRAFT_496723 [Sporormia fimetaria CBS 119925]